MNKKNNLTEDLIDIGFAIVIVLVIILLGYGMSKVNFNKWRENNHVETK